MTSEPIAEVIKRYREIKQLGYEAVLVDAFTLADAYLRELDETPITPEGLAVDGWMRDGSFFHHGKLLIGCTCGTWFFRNIPIHTIGEVRTLVRVFGSPS